MTNYKKGAEILRADAERLDPESVVLVEKHTASGGVVTQIGTVEALRESGTQFWHPYVSVFNVEVWEAQKKPQEIWWNPEP